MRAAMTPSTLSARVWLMALSVALAPGALANEAQAPAKGATQVAPALEPRAVDILKAMSARLAAAHTMTFTAVTVYESPSTLGPALAYTTVSHVTLERPDKLAVITPGDGSPSEFLYDGKTMTAYAPAENLVAVAEAPPTIDAALRAAYDSAAIYFPFTDVIVAHPYEDIAGGLRRAFYIGQSRVIGGTTTDMVAVADDSTFAQVWIGAGDRLPRLIRAVYAADPSRLRHEVGFTNWRLDGEVPAGAFTSARAEQATHIPFARPDPPPAPGARPPRKGRPSTTGGGSRAREPES
jgi:hypothetical protein